MIELQLLDGRILRFEQGEQTLRPGAGSLKERDIAAVAMDDLSASERSSRGPDFLLSEPGKPDRRLAVELKRNSSRTPTGSSEDQLAKYADDLFNRFGNNIPLQLWILSSDASSINVSNFTPEQGLETSSIYHLADVSTSGAQAPASADRIVAGKAEIDTEHILARVDDWEQRIKSLYEAVGEWCASIPDLELDQRLTISINEEMMQRYAVAPRSVPMLRVMRGTFVILTFKPYGLWIIGANGRLDVLTPKASYFIIDIAEQFAPPIWKLFGSSVKRSRNERLGLGVNFTPEVLGALLGG